MRKIYIILPITALIMITSCSKLKETKDDLECLNKLVKFNDDADDMNCAELIAALNSLENSCSAHFDEDDLTNFEYLKENCED